MNADIPLDSDDSESTRPIPVRIIAWLSVAFMALLTVVLILLTFGRQTESVRMELADTIEPASAALIDLQRILALEMAAQLSYRLDGSEQSLADYQTLLLREERAYQRLLPLTDALGAGASQSLTDLRVAVRLWHASVEGVAPQAQLQPPLRPTRDAAFANALRVAQQLSDRLVAIAADRRATIARRQRIENALIVGMVLLAGVALIALARLGNRLHALTFEARRSAGSAEERQQVLTSIAQEKETFIRGITHDLKNPLGVIGGAAELLEMGTHGVITDGQLDMVARIRRAAAEMKGIIDDLLDVSRAEAGALQLDAHHVDPNRLVAEIVNDYRTQLEANGLALRFEAVSRDVPLVTDPARVREILGNLLTNTLRHTPPDGSVHVAVREAIDDDGGAVIDIDVRDSGTGVPDDLRDVIFDEFARGSDSPGSGIGLAIGRKMARGLGGDLLLSETSERGSCFTLRLPLAPTEEEAPVSAGG